MQNHGIMLKHCFTTELTFLQKNFIAKTFIILKVKVQIVNNFA